MKIAFILHLFPNLSETFILHQITGLIDRGHEVDIYVNRLGPISRLHPVVSEYGLIEKCRLFHFGSNIHSDFVVRYRRYAALLFHSLLYRRDIIPAAISLSKEVSQRLLFRILITGLSFSRSKQYDIIHCHYGLNALLPAYFKRMGLVDTPVVVSFHGHDANVLPQKRGMDCYDCVFNNVDLCTVGTTFMREKIITLGADERSIVHLPVGVDISKFSFVERTSNPGDEIRVLTVARLVEVKGIEYSIRAFARASHTCRNMRYLIVGDGPLRDKLKTLVQELSLSDRVEFISGITHSSIKQLYADAHIFVLSSVVSRDGAQEGQGLVLLEAQATGLPVISTRTGGIPETVLDGTSAFLVPQRDVEALAKNMIRLAEDSELRRVMGHEGRKFVETYYSLDKLNDKLVSIYESLQAK